MLNNRKKSFKILFHFLSLIFVVCVFSLINIFLGRINIMKTTIVFLYILNK